MPMAGPEDMIAVVSEELKVCCDVMLIVETMWSVVRNHTKLI